jgi:hypothetical protein
MWISGVYAQAVVPNEFRRKFKIGKDVAWGNDPVPRTTATIKVADTGTLPAEDVNLAASPEEEEPPGLTVSKPPTPALGPGTGGLSSPEPKGADVPADASSAQTAATLRAYGRGLYQHPAVRAYTAGGVLWAASLVGPATEGDLRIIADGLRRRQSADQIAARIEVGA